MSGGSHGYIGRRMEDGDLVEQERELAGLPDDLRRYLGMPVTYEQPLTTTERDEIAMHGQAAVDALKQLNETVTLLKRQAAALAPLGEVIDRADSGDDCARDVWEAVLAWGRARERAGSGDLVDLFTRADPDQIGQDADTMLYEDRDVRAKATHAIGLVGKCAYGLLAVLEDPDGIHVSFVVLEFAGGGNPILWAPVFSGRGPSGPGPQAPGTNKDWCGLRELRHTNWGEGGYLFYPDGALIADAFSKLERWFDVGMAR